MVKVSATMRNASAQGIQFVTNNEGEKVAVIIDLKKHRELWEDISDGLIAVKRRNERRYTLETVRASLSKTGKLRA